MKLGHPIAPNRVLARYVPTGYELRLDMMVAYLYEGDELVARYGTDIPMDELVRMMQWERAYRARD